MVSDRAALKSPEPESKRLDRRRGDPDCREQVALAAPDDEVAARATGAQPDRGDLGENRCQKDGAPLSVTALATAREYEPVKHFVHRVTDIDLDNGTDEELTDLMRDLVRALHPRLANPQNAAGGAGFWPGPTPGADHERESRPGLARRI